VPYSFFTFIKSLKTRNFSIFLYKCSLHPARYALSNAKGLLFFKKEINFFCNLLFVPCLPLVLPSFPVSFNIKPGPFGRKRVEPVNLPIPRPRLRGSLLHLWNLCNPQRACGTRGASVCRSKHTKQQGSPHLISYLTDGKPTRPDAALQGGQLGTERPAGAPRLTPRRAGRRRADPHRDRASRRAGLHLVTLKP